LIEISKKKSLEEVEKKKNSVRGVGAYTYTTVVFLQQRMEFWWA
jgi:hypothetical protein